MAIKNASDLLVYAKTTAPAKQVTRIYVSNDPISLEDGETFGRLNINNVTNGTGVVSDAVVTGGITPNSATSVLNNLNTQLVTNNNYTSGSNTVSGDYTYRDFTNGAVGIVPTLEIVNGTGSDKATIKEGGIIVEITTPGSSAIFDPVAFSTSASFSTNMDLRDITNKDSGGYSESLGGLRSFEVSTDLLQSINPDVPLDGTDFFDKLKARSLVDLSFSDRIRNIIRTNLTQSGVDGFTTSGITQVNLQASPSEIGGSTASSIESTSANQDRLEYSIIASRLESKKLSWSFYVRGDGSTTKATFIIVGVNSSDYTSRIVGGNGSESISAYTPYSGYFKIEGLDTTWCRVVIEFANPLNVTSGTSNIIFRLYPGLAEAQSSNKVFTSSWQIEQTNEATNYQDPTDITHWQGNALVSSVSFDAGVEDNLTCSASFTGTGEIFPNGFGPELIGDTGFDNPSYWTVNPGTAGTSVVENGYGKILSPSGANTFIQGPASMMTIGDYYQVTYTVSSSPTPLQNFRIFEGWEASPDVDVICNGAAGTHTVLFKAGRGDFVVKRDSTSGETKIWLSSISLKKVL